MSSFKNSTTFNPSISGTDSPSNPSNGNKSTKSERLIARDCHSSYKDKLNEIKQRRKLKQEREERAERAREIAQARWIQLEKQRKLNVSSDVDRSKKQSVDQPVDRSKSESIIRSKEQSNKKQFVNKSTPEKKSSKSSKYKKSSRPPRGESIPLDSATAQTDSDSASEVGRMLARPACPPPNSNVSPVTSPDSPTGHSDLHHRWLDQSSVASTCDSEDKQHLIDTDSFFDRRSTCSRSSIARPPFDFAGSSPVLSLDIFPGSFDRLSSDGDLQLLQPNPRDLYISSLTETPALLPVSSPELAIPQYGQTLTTPGSSSLSPPSTPSSSSDTLDLALLGRLHQRNSPQFSFTLPIAPAAFVQEKRARTSLTPSQRQQLREQDYDDSPAVQSAPLTISPRSHSYDPNGPRSFMSPDNSFPETFSGQLQPTALSSADVEAGHRSSLLRHAPSGYDSSQFDTRQRAPINRQVDERSSPFSPSNSLHAFEQFGSTDHQAASLRLLRLETYRRASLPVSLMSESDFSSHESVNPTLKRVFSQTSMSTYQSRDQLSAHSSCPPTPSNSMSQLSLQSSHKNSRSFMSPPESRRPMLGHHGPQADTSNALLHGLQSQALLESLEQIAQSNGALLNQQTASEHSNTSAITALQALLYSQGNSPSKSAMLQNALYAREQMLTVALQQRAQLLMKHAYAQTVPGAARQVAFLNRSNSSASRTSPIIQDQNVIHRMYLP